MLINIRKYGILGLINLAINFIYTKIVFSQAFLIRRPSHIRVVGRTNIGCRFIAGPGLILDVLRSNAKLTIGNNVMINHRCHIGVMESVAIGDDVLIASNVFISDHAHGQYRGDFQSSPEEPPNKRNICCAPVVIANKVWIGENVAILHGVSIGESSIIGANSVVTKSIPAYVIAAGVPAKVIKCWNHAHKKWVSVIDD